MVGETSEGDPIFEIRSVRLVFRSDANHFNRVAACSKCGREVPGAAVLSPADLDLTPHPVFCTKCVSAAGTRLIPTEASRPRKPTLAPRHAEGGNGSAPTDPVPPQADDARMAALERGLADLSAQLATERFTAAAAIGPATEQFGDRLAALERRLDEAVEHLKAGEATQRSELLKRVDDLQNAVESDAHGRRDDVVRLTEDIENRRLALDEMSRRVDDVVERLTEAQSGPARVQDLEERLQRVQADVEAGSGLAQRLEQLVGSIDAQRAELEATLRTRMDHAQTALQANVEQTSADLLSARDEMGRGQDELRRGLADDLARAEAQLNERVDRLADGVLTHRSDILATLDERVGEVETALARSAQALSGKEELGRARDELRREIESLTGSVQQLGAGLEEELGLVESDLVRVDARLSHRLLGLAEGVVAQRSELEAMLVAHVEEAQVGLGALAEKVATQTAAHERAQDELARLGEQLNERLDRLAERAARTDAAEDPRPFEALRQQVADTAGSVNHAFEAQRADLQRQLDDGLAEVRAAVGASGGADAERLQDIEDRTAQMAARLSEIDELLEVLDAGFGELRSGLDELRDPADVVRGVETGGLSDKEPLPRRLGKRSKATAHLAEVKAITEDLVSKYRHLESQLDRLERAASPPVKAVTRAGQSAALAPLRADVAAVREDLAAHEEALAKLSRSVEALRRKVRAAAPAANPTPRKKKS